MFRRLTIEFESLDDFQREYQRNIANGGMFASTDETFEMREVIEVELALRFCGKTVPLQCEVVGRVSPAAGGPKQRAGIAVQFLEPTDDLRSLFAEWVGLGSAPKPEPTQAPWLERQGPERRHERSSVYAATEVISTGGVQHGETRNLSRSGALLTLHENPPPRVGEAVTVSIVHPSKGDARRIAGRVVRSSTHLRDRPTVAIAFEIPPSEHEDISNFLGEICQKHGSVASNAIAGPIHVLGLPSLVQMFSSSAEGGTLTVFCNEQTGRIVFASGGLQQARVGEVTGPKALSRMLTWDRGRFEFVPVVPPDSEEGEPIPMYGVLLESIQLVDELARLDLSHLPSAGQVARTPEAAPADLTKLQQDLLGLVEAGGTVAEIVDRCEAFDAQIYAGLLEILQLGLIEVRPPDARIV